MSSRWREDSSQILDIFGLELAFSKEQYNYT